MLFRLFGKKKKEEDVVFKEFKSQIEKHGMTIDSVDEKGLITISLEEDLNVKVNLDNVRKNYERDNDKAHISDLVNTLLSYSTQLPNSWVDAKENIYISFFPNESEEFEKCIQHRITEEFSKGYVYRGEGKFSWILSEDLKNWDITEVELDKQADVNANKLLKKTKITFSLIENRKLGMVEIEDVALKATLLFASNMKEKVNKDFGFPFYAVIPVRDFCYIFSEKDFDFFTERIGSVVVEEYQQSGYPITTEILKFTDDGVKAVGKYPIK